MRVQRLAPLDRTLSFLPAGEYDLRPLLMRSIYRQLRRIEDIHLLPVDNILVAFLLCSCFQFVCFTADVRLRDAKAGGMFPLNEC